MSGHHFLQLMYLLIHQAWRTPQAKGRAGKTIVKANHFLGEQCLQTQHCTAIFLLH